MNGISKDVPTDMSAAAVGSSLTLSKLEEVQTVRRGEGKNQKKRKKKPTKKHKPTNKEQNTYTKNVHTAGAGSRTEGKEKEKTQSTQVLTTENSWNFLLNQMDEKDIMLTVEVVCIWVMPSHPFKAP